MNTTPLTTILRRYLHKTALNTDYDERGEIRLVGKPPSSRFFRLLPSITLDDLAYCLDPECDFINVHDAQDLTGRWILLDYYYTDNGECIITDFQYFQMRNEAIDEMDRICNLETA